jgi:hypothetical protein
VHRLKRSAYCLAISTKLEVRFLEQFFNYLRGVLSPVVRDFDDDPENKRLESFEEFRPVMFIATL